MKVDGGLSGIDHAGELARAQEDTGYDGTWTAELGHDPFLPILPAAGATSRIELGTGIAVAFARSPMTVAYTANDLQAASGGRFVLGLGSQVKAHIEKRFSMPWSHPAARMREFVLALRAIWGAWDSGARLDFRGDFYTHTLMTPFFSPGRNPHGNPKVFVAAVGERMAEVAGEVADGLLVHPFTTARYLREVTIPALEAGLVRAGRSRADVELSCPLFVVPAGEAGTEQAASFVRQQIAFYGSTPAYKQVLDLHGWGELQPRLNTLSKQGGWMEMAGLVGDDIVDAFAVVAPRDGLAAAILNRFAGVVDRVSFYGPVAAGPDEERALVAALQAG